MITPLARQVGAPESLRHAVDDAATFQVIRADRLSAQWQQLGHTSGQMHPEATRRIAQLFGLSPTWTVRTDSRWPHDLVVRTDLSGPLRDAFRTLRHELRGLRYLPNEALDVFTPIWPAAHVIDLLDAFGCLSADAAHAADSRPWGPDHGLGRGLAVTTGGSLKLPQFRRGTAPLDHESSELGQVREPDLVRAWRTELAAHEVVVGGRAGLARLRTLYCCSAHPLPGKTNMPDSTRKLVDDALGGKYKVVELLGAPARFQASYKARPTGKRGGGTSVVSITSDSHSRWTFGSKQVYEMGARKADFRHVLRYSELKSIEGPGSQSYTISIRPYLPRTLSESTSTGLPKTRAWRALEDVLKGLIELHRNGLVHGDLTPSNVFFDRVWTIGDFGRSKDSSLLSEADQPFVAPELRAGEPASAAADIYSFGQLAHSLLSFDDPGVSSSVELSAAQLRWILECCQRRSAEDRPSADALYNLMFDRPALIRVARRSVRDATPWTGSPTTSGRRSRELREAANRDRTAVRHAMADLSHAPQLALFLQTPAAARRYTALLDRALVFATPSADDGNRDPVAVMEAESKSYSSSGIDDEWVRQIERAYRRDFKSGTAVDPEEVSRMMSRFAHTFRIANEVRGELLASCPMYYTHEVARLLSDQEMDVTEADILNLSQTPRLLVVRDHGRFLYPTFQFAEARIRPVVGEVNEILGTTGHEWSTISWWYSPHGMFADYPRPVDHVVESEQVLAAARFSVR